MTTPSPRSLKMAFNLVKIFTSLWKMIIFCNCHLNLNNFQIVCHKATSQENVMGFPIQIWLPVLKRDIISFMSTVEDTRTKSMFIAHFGRHNNWIGKCIIYQLSYEILEIIINLAIKLWDLVKLKVLKLFSFSAILLRNHRTVLTIHFRAE